MSYELFNFCFCYFLRFLYVAIAHVTQEEDRPGREVPAPEHLLVSYALEFAATALAGVQGVLSFYCSSWSQY